MTLLNQIVAVESGVKKKAERTLTEADKVIQKDAPFSGIARNYDPKDDDGDKLPPESTRVQQNVEEILDQVAASMTDLFDVTLTKDVANQDAVADLVVDGQTIATQVPVPFMLTLEKKLVDLRTFVSKLPILDPAETWVHDQTTGTYATNPTVTTRSKRVPRAFVRYEATPQHPAQVETVFEDVLAGYWTTRKLSGRITQERANELINRVDRLSAVVKSARELANTREVTDQRIGAKLFTYLFGSE